MKSIYFNKYNSWKNGLVIIPGAFFVLLSGLDMLTDLPGDHTKFFSLLGHLFLAIYWGRIFLFKNYVAWNKLVMNIKIDSFWFNTFSFNKVSNISSEKDLLKISLMHGKEHQFDLGAIKMADRDRLMQILEAKIPSSLAYD